MNANRDLAVIVLNWNNPGDTLDCLETLATSIHPVHVIVVDNGSTDDSLARLRESSVPHELIETGANRGYAGGNNVGLRHALAQGFEYIAVLNNDTLATDSTWQRLLDHLASVSRPVALSPLILHADEARLPWFEGGVVRSGWARHAQPTELPPAQGGLRPTEILSGCCIVASRTVWNTVGQFDEGFFLIFEDTDWSLRARRLGIDLAVALDAQIDHRVSRTFSTSGAGRIGSFYFTRNGLRCMMRHRPLGFPHFLARWALKPLLKAMVARRFPGDADCIALGAIAFFLGRSGRAPRSVEQRAALPAVNSRRPAPHTS